HETEEDAAADGCRSVGRLGPERALVRDALLVESEEHPGDQRQQQDVDGQDDERAPSAHPSAKLLDDDRGDSRSGPGRPKSRQPKREPTRERAHWTAPGFVAASPSSSRSVTCRNSSWRSVAAGE